MAQFVGGVLSSIVASGILVVAGWFGSRRLRGWAIGFLARLTGVGITGAFSTQSAANQAMADDVRHARQISALVSRGNELTRDSFISLWSRPDQEPGSVRLLLPDPDATGGDAWIDRREAEVGRHDPGFSGGLLARQVRSNLEYLRGHVSHRSDVRVRLYDFPHLARIVVTDRVAYLTTYQESEHGRNSPCLVFRHPSAMYDFCLRIFEQAWRDARPAAF